MKIKFRHILFMALAMAGIMIPVSSSADEYWDMKTSLFDVLPVKEGDIVFLGNSITDGGEFHELFEMPNIKNRGIRSDVITGVEKRLSQVTAGHPAKIFLLIGINDISHGLSIDNLASRYERLVKKIRSQSPDTKLYVQSIMPVNNSFRRYKNLLGREHTVTVLNTRIKKIAGENNARYIDLWTALSSDGKTLDKQFTADGLHLNGAGYRAWTKAIEPYVKE